MSTFTEDRATFDFANIKEGDGLGFSITFDFDLTGYHTWRGHIRKTPSATAAIIAEWGVDPVGAEPNRTVRFFLTPAQVTLALNGAGYDLEVLDDNDEPHTFCEGEFEIIPQYTR